MKGSLNYKFKLDFYYWNYQCPLNFDIICLLKKYEDRIHIAFHDVSINHQLAKEKRMYFPTLVVVNNEHRYYSPITEPFLETLVLGKLPVEKPYIPKLGKVISSGNILPITRENGEITCSCTGGCSKKACQSKNKFRSFTSSGEICGFANIDVGGSCVGGVEWITSNDVPYNIPKSKDYVFITCLYSSDPIYDYKSSVLKEAEKYLFKHYKKIYIISDELSVFPNGNLKYFTEKGYVDEGVIFYDSEYCKLHLLSLNVNEMKIN